MNPLKVHSLSPIKIELSLLPGFPGGSDSKESACQAGEEGRGPSESSGAQAQILLRIVPSTGEILCRDASLCAKRCLPTPPPSTLYTQRKFEEKQRPRRDRLG